MNLKPLLFSTALALSAPVLAEDCLPGFGPGCVTPTVPTTPERIPIHPAALAPIWVGDGYATVAGQVVADDFVLLVATLPNGYRVAGVSGACTTDAERPTCPNLALFALYDLRLRIDLALRARAFGA